MNDNGKTNAFPFTEYPNSSELGLSKREYFAAIAMQGIISANDQFFHGNIPIPVSKIVVDSAIEFADELLKQLEK